MNILASASKKSKIISVTEEAVKEMKNLLNQAEKTYVGIRIKISNKGCSGHKYSIEYASDVLPFEEVVDIENLRILIDPKAIMYLMNSEVDYKRDIFSEGFVFKNPNEKGKCGCGKSFAL